MKQNFLKNRSAGILMPISSLPSPYGIGTIGHEAYSFIDKLRMAGQSFWQVLPVGPTSYGDSPYQSFSAFAGNPYFIDLDFLVEKGLLQKEEISDLTWGTAPDQVDYAQLYQNRFSVLKKAFSRSRFRKSPAYFKFLGRTRYWLDDYCLYMACKEHFDNQAWQTWDEDIRYHRPEAVKKYQNELKQEIRFWEFCQYTFFEQWDKLKKYALQQGIRIIGDIPLYVAMDSADVWAHPRLFDLDERENPNHVAGVPPDCFSEEGQRWGNPIYAWKAMEKEHFRWWSHRMKANARLFDVIRIDHFIGIVNFWSIPVSCPTAVDGQWCKGPGKKLAAVIRKATKGTDIIAEDLGVVGPEVRALQEKTGWPGMKVLEFAFDGNAENEYLPHNYQTSNCLVYGGTHDNETLLGYYGALEDDARVPVMDYLNIKELSELPDTMLRCAYMSIANTVIFQMQDILGLDNAARMNHPSTLGTNWRWRMLPDAFSGERISFLQHMTNIYGRTPQVPSKKTHR